MSVLPFHLSILPYYMESEAFTLNRRKQLRNRYNLKTINNVIFSIDNLGIGPNED